MGNRGSDLEVHINFADRSGSAIVGYTAENHSRKGYEPPFLVNSLPTIRRGTLEFSTTVRRAGRAKELREGEKRGLLHSELVSATKSRYRFPDAGLSV